VRFGVIPCFGSLPFATVFPPSLFPLSSPFFPPLFLPSFFLGLSLLASLAKRFFCQLHVCRICPYWQIRHAWSGARNWHLTKMLTKRASCELPEIRVLVIYRGSTNSHADITSTQTLSLQLSPVAKIRPSRMAGKTPLYFVLIRRMFMYRIQTSEF